MQFRTEIGPVKGGFEISHSDRIVLIGSCFADNVGERLDADGFTTVHNPLGPLFNPASVLRAFSRGPRPYGEPDFTEHAGMWHCLDFANRFQAASPGELTKIVNEHYLPFAQAIADADVLIFTFGTAEVWAMTGGAVAGNCHKLPGTMVAHTMLSTDEIAGMWSGADFGSRRVIFTVSPVRYTSGGLPCNSLSKSRLRVAVDEICRATGADYFPSFEILNDDLRDYRFYARDLRHPSDVAADYIYEHFGRTYFSADTIAKAAECRRAFLRSQHRPIISQQ